MGQLIEVTPLVTPLGGGEIVFINMNQVLKIDASGHDIRIHLANGVVLFVKESLEEIRKRIRESA